MRFLICFLISFSSAAAPYLVFRENGKVGLKDEAGKIIIPAQYEAIGWSNGQFSVLNNVTGYRSNTGWGLINLDNRKLTKQQFEELLPGGVNFIIARKKINNSPRLVTGCINTSGKEVIPFIYDGILISSLRAVVFTKIGNQYKYGLIDLENKTLIPQQYQDVRPIGTLRYAVRNFEGKTALYSEQGKQITGFVIDSLSDFRKNYAILFQNSFKGLMDREGQVKLEPKYTEIQVLDDGTVRAKEGDDWSFLDGQNKVLKNFKADSVVVLEENLLKVRTGDAVQLVNPDLKPVTPSFYSDIKPFANGKAIYRLGNFYGVLYRDGSVVLPALYDQVISGPDYFIASQKISGREAWVMFDSTGNRRMNRAYEKMSPLAGGKYFTVKNRNAWGLINSKGQEVIACAYDSLVQFRDNLLVVKFRGLQGIISVSEEWVVTPSEGRLQLIRSDRYLQVNNGTTTLKAIKGGTIYFTTNCIEVTDGFIYEFLPSGDRWKIDMNGVIADRMVVPDQPVEKIFEESEGLRAIKRNGRYGFIDSRGRLRIANRYEAAQPFREGLAAIKILGKWGFINTMDNIAVQPTYEEVQSFQGGFALVKQKGQYGLIDIKGKQVLPVRYSSIEVQKSGNLVIVTNGVYGLADNTGKVMIQPRYQELSDCGNGYVVVQKDKKYGIVNYQGLSTVPVVYDYLTFDAQRQHFIAMKRSSFTEIK